jgi:hypothetical protein
VVPLSAETFHPARQFLYALQERFVFGMFANIRIGG